MAHLVKLKDIFSMLDECAPGHHRRENQEYWLVTYNKKSYRGLPRGPHGRRVNPDIETGHVRALVRHFDISRDCVSKHLDLH